MSEKQDLSVKTLEAEEIIVRGGKHKLFIQGTSQGVGLWLSEAGRTKKCIAIFSLDDQTAIGLYGKDNPKAMAIALMIDQNGDPAVQVTGEDDKIVFLTLDDLRAVAKQKPTQL